MNQLEQLKQHTIIVADSGDIDSIIAYQPEDATTNPSLIYKAAQLSQYQALIKEAVTTLKSRLADPDPEYAPVIIRNNRLHVG
ncbi:transaldolase family protein, partial [Raoultella planticola]|uniref:transaldolase family protein n=1 Tax=Raoultella planticola TaxID=575 RepID=UPI0023EE51A5